MRRPRSGWLENARFALGAMREQKLRSFLTLLGVTAGFEKQLELNGVGYRMAVAGKKLNLALGFSHPVEMAIPEGVAAKVENNILTLSGIDKQMVGEFAAVVRKKKPVEPYKGKGFRYVGEIVRRKEGKKAAA